MVDERILNDIEEAKILSIFKNIYNDYSNYKEKNTLRNMLSISPDKLTTLKQIIKRKYDSDFSEMQLKRLSELVEAFLKKSEYRKSITEELRSSLLITQNYKCAICNAMINEKAPADHIVQFKYVGDELNNNIQMLCKKCNEKKNDSIDYQIRFLLKLV